MPSKSYGCAFGPEHGFRAGVHFFLFDRLAALSRGDPFFYGGNETYFVVEVPGSDIRPPARG